MSVRVPFIAAALAAAAYLPAKATTVDPVPPSASFGVYYCYSLGFDRCFTYSFPQDAPYAVNNGDPDQNTFDIQIQSIGPNRDAQPSSYTRLVAIAFEPGTFEFDWTYVTRDPEIGDDIAGWEVNGTSLFSTQGETTNVPVSGTASVEVQAGDIFGFWMYKATNALYEEGVLSAKGSFVPAASVVPLPASSLFLVSALMLLRARPRLSLRC